MWTRFVSISILVSALPAAALAQSPAPGALKSRTDVCAIGRKPIEDFVYDSCVDTLNSVLDRVKAIVGQDACNQYSKLAQDYTSAQNAAYHRASDLGAILGYPNSTVDDEKAKGDVTFRALIDYSDRSAIPLAELLSGKILPALEKAVKESNVPVSLVKLPDVNHLRPGHLELGAQLKAELKTEKSVSGCGQDQRLVWDPNGDGKSYESKDSRDPQRQFWITRSNPNDQLNMRVTDFVDQQLPGCNDERYCQSTERYYLGDYPAGGTPPPDIPKSCQQYSPVEGYCKVNPGDVRFCTTNISDARSTNNAVKMEIPSSEVTSTSSAGAVHSGQGL